MQNEGTYERPVVTLLWRIKNLRHWEPIRRRQIESSGCKSNALLGLVTMALYPRGEVESDRYLRLELRSPKLDFPIDCEYAFLDHAGSPSFIHTLRNRFSERLPLNGPTLQDVYETRMSTFLPRGILTVRCRIWKSEGKFELDEFFSLHSKVEFTELSFVWPIERVSSLQRNNVLSTKTMTNDENENIRLEFFLSPNGHPSVRLKIFTPYSNRNITLKISMLTKAHSPRKYVEKKFGIREGSYELTYEIPEFISMEEVMEKKSDYLCDDVLTLFFEITHTRGICTSSLKRLHYGPLNLKPGASINALPFSEASIRKSADPAKMSTHTHLEWTSGSQQRNDLVAALQEDFLTLYRDQELCDFQLLSGDVSFPVHKIILKARSPVFRAMFCSDMEESDSKTLDIPDLDTHTLGRMLTFLYGGTMEPLQWEGAVKLYYAADKYQVPSLKLECSSILRSNVTVSNVSDVLALADRHQDTELTLFVHDFILSHFNEIMHSEEWESFLDNNPHCAGKTMHQLSKKRPLNGQ